VVRHNVALIGIEKCKKFGFCKGFAHRSILSQPGLIALADNQTIGPLVRRVKRKMQGAQIILHPPSRCHSAQRVPERLGRQAPWP